MLKLGTVSPTLMFPTDEDLLALPLTLVGIPLTAEPDAAVATVSELIGLSSGVFERLFV